MKTIHHSGSSSGHTHIVVAFGVCSEGTYHNLEEGKIPPGCLSAELVIQVTRFSIPLDSEAWHFPTECHTLSVAYPLCGPTLTDPMDNLPEICPTKLTDGYILIQRRCQFCTNNHTQSYRGLILSSELSQVVLTQDQTCSPQMREKAQ